MLTRPAKGDAGFTLLEMVVTMGIFALLVALGVPTMRTWLSNVKVRAMADALQNGVRAAQSESLRRSRQVVFALTNSATPQNLPVNAVTNGNSWAVWTVPAMTDGSEANAYIDSGVLSSSTANVRVTAQPGAAAICFSSVGRLVPNGLAGVTSVTGGATCSLPAGAPPGAQPGAPPAWAYNIALIGADHPLQVQVGLGGQIHMCDPSKALSSTNPDGC